MSFQRNESIIALSALLSSLDLVCIDPLLEEGKSAAKMQELGNSIEEFEKKYIETKKSIEKKLEKLDALAIECGIKAVHISKGAIYFVDKKEKITLPAALSRTQERTPQSKPSAPSPSLRIKSLYGVLVPPTTFPISPCSRIPESIHLAGENEKYYPFIRVGNIIVQVPFPDVIDASVDRARNMSIKCRYGSRDKCVRSRPYRTECNYAHTGERYTKVRFSCQSPNMPWFGQHHSLFSDMNKLTIEDIKIILFYATSDLLLVKIWSDMHLPKPITVFGCDKC